jgi:hypothetical protein
MLLSYKGHCLGTIPWRIRNSRKWRAKVIVQWSEGAILKTQHFDSPGDGFGSEERADLWAIALGRKWIDDGKPDIEPVHIQEPLPSI